MVIDIVADESPLFGTVLQIIGLLRDTTHMQDYRVSEWQNFFTLALRTYDYKMGIAYAI